MFVISRSVVVWIHMPTGVTRYLEPSVNLLKIIVKEYTWFNREHMPNGKQSEFESVLQYDVSM